MRCPRCSDRFVSISTGDGALFGCPTCAGLWVERKVLLQLVRRAAADAGVTRRALGLVETPGVAVDRRCPSCMASSLLTLTMRSVPVERCTSCFGIFLDSGELQTIAKRVIEAQLQWETEEGEWARLSRKLRRAPAPSLSAEVGWAGAEVALLVGTAFLGTS